MKLYDFHRAPNPRRVRIFLAEKGIDIPVEQVDVPNNANRTPEFLQKNAFGELPVLELDDGTCLPESVAICRYFEETHPEPPLMGVDTRDRARVEMWNRRMELELFRHVADFFRNTGEFFKTRITQVPAVGDVARALAAKRLVWLDDSLADGRPFIAGDRYTIADITALVAIQLGTPSVFGITPDQPHLTRWYEVAAARPSAQA